MMCGLFTRFISHQLQSTPLPSLKFLQYSVRLRFFGLLQHPRGEISHERGFSGQGDELGSAY